jgi:Tol biopolymer transport system component
VLADAPPQPPVFTVGDRAQTFVAERDGGARRLAGGPDFHGNPAWSRRGRRIAVTTRHSSEIRTPGGALRPRVRGGGAFTSGTAWGPDDKRIAFVTYKTYPLFGGNLVVSDVDGDHRRVLVRSDSVFDPPDWSPDGRTIYFRRYGDSQTIYAKPTRGGRSKVVAEDASNRGPILVSPDGARVLFRRGAGRSWAWIAPADGTGDERLVGEVGYPGYYGWVADGRVFGGKADGHPVLTSPSGGRRVLGARFHSEQYTVSPDGRWVAWIGEEHSAVQAARADGSGYRVLARLRATGNTVDVVSLIWSPDGRRVALEAYEHFDG